MKLKATLTLLLFSLVLNLFAQNKITAYQYWYDNDTSFTTVNATTPVSPYTLNTSFNVSGLASGLHTFNVRFKDDSARYSAVLSQFFFKKPVLSSGSNPKIVKYQIWYDDDFDNVTTTTVSPAVSLDLTSSLNASNLATGLHTLSLRFQDDEGNWSVPISQFFFKKPETTTSSNANIVKYQIWYDADFDNATTQAVSAAVSFNLVSNLNVSNLATGIHTVSLRFQDAKGAWSVPVSQFFFKKPETGISNSSNLVSYEYWFDDDYANANLQSVMGTQQLDLLKNIDVSSLNMGLHSLTIRFRDENGNWSVPISQFFFKKPETAIVSNELVQYRYWFNEDDDNMTYSAIVPSVTPFELIKTFDMTHLWEGDYSIHFQFKDQLGKWSVVTTDSIHKASLPIASFTQSSAKYCDSVVVQFKNQSVDADSVLWTFGDGSTSSEWEPTHTFTSENTYSVQLYVKDTSSGFDSTISNNVVVEFIPESYASLDTTVCESYTSPSGKYVWTNSNTYTDTLVNSLGCDSIITIQLTVNYTQYKSIAAASCFQYVSPSLKHTWTESGLYTDTLVSSAMCDSIISIGLTIHNVDTGVTKYNTTLTATADTATYQWVDCNNGNAPIAGETSKSFTPTKNGSYAVIVTQGNCGLMSRCFEISNVGVSENTISTDILLYPNPTDGSVTIDLNRSCTHISIEIRDIAGRLISRSYQNAASIIPLEIDGKVGFYYITLLSDQGKATMRVLKE